MDKAMHQVTKRIKTATHDLIKGQKKRAIEVLSKAAKKNEKLVKIDREVRDPEIKAYKKLKKKKGRK